MIIRIDDFPTGVRPIIPEIGELFAILDHFERNRVTFHLGIVPMTLRDYVSKPEINYLKRYRYMVPCQHGYDHRYAEMCAKLLQAGDPGNRKTIGTFDEFEGDSTSEVTRKIKEGRSYLQQRLNRLVDHYIPVCNTVDARLGAALRSAGFRKVFVMPGVTIDGVENITTDYYGHMAGYKGQSVAGLHITWEWDWIQTHGRKMWDENFKKLL